MIIILVEAAAAFACATVAATDPLKQRMMLVPIQLFSSG